MSSECNQITFKDYEVNMYNRNAYEVSKNFVSKDIMPKRRFGIFGLENAGKTKLLQAMSNYLIQRNPSISISFISGIELLEELKNENSKSIFLTGKLKKKYRKCNIICIDEIQHMFDGGDIQKVYERFFQYLMLHKKYVFLPMTVMKKYMRH